MSIRNSAHTNDLYESTRKNRLKSKNVEQTKESEADQLSIASPKPFQRRPSKMASKRGKLQTESNLNNEEHSPFPLNDRRVRGLVSISSLKTFKNPNDDNVGGGVGELRRSRKIGMETEKKEKTGEHF